MDNIAFRSQSAFLKALALELQRQNVHVQNSSWTQIFRTDCVHTVGNLELSQHTTEAVTPTTL